MGASLLASVHASQQAQLASQFCPATVEHCCRHLLVAESCHLKFTVLADTDSGEHKVKLMGVIFSHEQIAVLSEVRCHACASCTCLHLDHDLQPVMPTCQQPLSQPQPQKGLSISFGHGEGGKLAGYT